MNDNDPLFVLHPYSWPERPSLAFDLLIAARQLAVRHLRPVAFARSTSTDLCVRPPFDAPSLSPFLAHSSGTMSDSNREPGNPTTRGVGRGARPAATHIVSPPGSRTPPSMPAKTTLFFPEPTGAQHTSRHSSGAIDPNALTKALRDFEDAGRSRERTPGASPSRKRQRVYGDR